MPVYDGETGLGTLRKLARSYLTVVKDLSRVMNRLKALYLSWSSPAPAGMRTIRAIAASGWRRFPSWNAPASRATLSAIGHAAAGASKRAANFWRRAANTPSPPSCGRFLPWSICSALAVALIQTPHRFRSKRQLWTYSGLGLETRAQWAHDYVRGQVRRRKKQATIRGLNKDYNHDLKKVD